MFTMVAWQQSVAENSAYTALNAVIDNHVTTSGTIIYVPKLNNLIGVAAQVGTNGTKCKLRSPSLRGKVEHEVHPVANSATTIAPFTYAMFTDLPIPLTEGEGLEALTLSSDTTASVKTVIAFLSDGPISPVTGEVMTVGVSATITSVVGQWVGGSLTFSQTLPRGRYALVGASFYETDCLAVRFVPIGESHRPGVIGRASVSTIDNPLFRYGKMGSFFEFDSLTPPSIEILHAAAASQSINGYVDLIRVG